MDGRQRTPGERTEPAPRARRAWLLLPLVAAGCVAAVVLRAGAGDGTTALRAEGPTWSVRDESLAVVRLDPAPTGLPLRAGQALWIGAPGARGRDVAPLTSLAIEIGPSEERAALVDIRLPGDGYDHRVYIVPTPPLRGFLAVRRGEGPWEPLAQVVLPDAPVVPPAARDDASRPFRLELDLVPGRLALRHDATPLLTVDDAELGPVPYVSLRARDARLRALSARRVGGPDEHEDFVDGFAARRAAGARADALRLVAVGLFVAFGVVGSRRAGRVPLARRLAATAAFLAWPALPLAVSAWIVPLPSFVLAAACAALAVPGLRLALGVLGAGRSPPGTARRARAVGVAVLVAIVLAAGAWSAGTRQAALREARRLAARDVAGPLERAPFRLAEPVTLDLGNALELPGTRRDLDLRARVTLGRGALLELRLHAPEREQALGVAFCAGDVGRYGARFCRLDSLDFEPLGEGASSVPVGRPFDLLVRVRDGRYVAWIDGARVAQAECRGFPAGSGFVLAAAGSVQVESLQLDAVDVPGASPVPRRAGWTWAAAALAGFAALGLLATWPLRQAAWHAFESTAFAWAPLALLLHGTGAEPDRADLVLVAGAAALLVLVHPASTRADAARPDAARPDAAQPDAARPDAVRPAAGRPALFVLAGLAIVLGPVLVLAVPRDAARRPELTHDHVFPGPRLTPGLVAFEHPAIRFLNRWLRAHRLRGSRFPLRAPPGTVRVLAAGSSSTWGHGLDEDGGLDYPTVLGGLLRERVPGVAIEALNGAIPGTSSARHLRFFRECLLAYGPDVVTLCFTFNDSHNATYLDEHPYLDAIASPDYEHDTAARREAAEAADAGNRKLKRLLAAFAAQGPPTAPLWDAIDDDPHARPPPERFLSTLRAWARLCAERGIALVLIKEPLRNDRPLPWKEEFRAAIDAVAAEYSLPVVDPTPALLAEERAGTMFMDDVHPTPAGHAVIAREVADAVEALVRRIAAER